ncbi:MAG: terminase [Paenibacillus sp.]|nr:terminase [Paenibacillus sp.]
MGRQRDPKRDKAKEIYIASKGETSLIDIASQLGVSDGTVRAWKNRDKWDVTDNATLQKEKRNATKETKRYKQGDKREVADKVTDYDESVNEELTDRQRIFCLYYVKSFNATQAAIKAGYASDSAHVRGYELVRNSKVSDEIKRIKGNMANALFVDAMDVLNKYAAIAFADIKDYVDFGQQDVPLMTKKGPVLNHDGEMMMTKQSFVAFRNADEVDGTIISEVKEGKDGISVKLHDKMKALEVLTKYLDLLPDNHKRMIEEEKLKLDRERLELDKAKAAGEGDLDEALIDDWVLAVMDDGTTKGGEKS